MERDRRKMPDPSDYQKEDMIHEINIGDFNYNGMRIYGSNVTLMRAIPDIIDGFKPVERRILYSTAFIAKALKKKKKALAIIGSTIMIHPHGDAPLADTVVNMSKPWENPYPLLEIKGNNGQPGNGASAAPRYLNAKISNYCEDCFFKEWNDNIVEMTRSYNPDYDEPLYLNPRYPNILLRPVTGFTFSISTSFPSYNLTEAFNEVIKLIKNPDYDPILYPDMPSGCIIVDEGQFPDICHNGEGSFKMKAEVEVDSTNHKLIIHSLPYQVSISRIIETLLKLKKEGNLPGVTSVFDGSNKYGINIEITCSKDVLLEDILEILYKKTALITTFSTKFVFVDNYELKAFNLKGVMEKWISNRRLFKHKYITYRSVQLRERNHILEPLIDIISDEKKCQEMIHDIRHCKTSEIVEKLCKRYKNLTSLQAKEIAEMKIKYFSADNLDKFKSEFKSNKDEIKHLDDMLENQDKIDKEIIKELQYAIDKYSTHRKSPIEKITKSKVSINRNYKLIITRKGMIKKLIAVDDNTNIGNLNIGDVPIKVMNVKDSDTLILFDKGGMVHSLKVSNITQSEKKSKGTSLGKYISIKGDIIMIESLSNIDKDNGEFIFVTESGMIKRTSCKNFSFKTSVIGMILKGDDSVSSVNYIESNSDIILYTKNGFGNRFNTDDITSTSRMSSGVIGIDKEENDIVVGSSKVDKKDTYMVIVTTKGNGKICSLKSFTSTKRRGEALKLITLKDKEELFDVESCTIHDKFYIWSVNSLESFKASDLPELTRNHAGKKIFSIGSGDKLIQISKI